jgi:hypothetical protein
VRNQENVRERLARQRRDEAERIAIRMGFHGAFLRATATETAGADQARVGVAARPSKHAGWRRGVRRVSAA